MKKIRRERALATIYAGLSSRDFDEREYALFQLALVIQRSQASAAGPDTPDLYQENLTRDLLRIRMTPGEQREAAKALAEVIASFPESRSSAFWASSHLSAEVGLPVVMAMAVEFGGQLGVESAYQVCRALGHWLASAELTQAFIDERLGSVGRLECLERWTDSADARLAEAAGRLRLVIKSTGG